MDKYQVRYVAHQLKKKKQLVSIIKQRHSSRVFSDKPVTDKEIKTILDCARLVPNSCNRQAVEIDVIEDRDNKALLGGLLVGGVGWVHRADKILLIKAAKQAYKENLIYMPYLDMGVVVQQTYLVCTAIGVKCCYVNPNVRETNMGFFNQKFNMTDYYYGGAMAVGK